MTFLLVAAAIAVLACLVVGRTAPILLRRMRPAQAVLLLTVTALAVSLSSGIALAAIGVAVIASLTSVAAGHWSATVIRTEFPIPSWLGAVATAAVSVLLLRSAARTVSIVLALIRADRLCRDIRGCGGPVVLVDDDSVDAYTVAGIHGCVVISQRLFSQLSADERRVLTAHELSHLHRRHHLYVHLADIAAAANPFLRAVPPAVRLGVERWADEDAAAGTGDRRMTGRALARVALLRASLSRTASDRAQPVRVAMLGAAALQVTSRVQALLAPAPNPRPGRVALGVVLAVTVLMIGLASLDHIQDAIESAAPHPR